MPKKKANKPKDKSLTVEQIKRFIALLKAEIEYDKDFKLKLPEGFKESFEKQKEFRGWINYHVTWEVHPKDPWKIVLRSQSLVQDWHDELIKMVPVITPEGKIVGANEWDKKSASTQ